MCCGLIWAEMREQQEVKATGQRENEEGRGFFRSQSERVISMLAGRCSNEESSILRLQSSFPIASCGVVAWRWLDELSTSSVQNVDWHAGVGSWVQQHVLFYEITQICLCTHPHVQTSTAWHGGGKHTQHYLVFVFNHF